MTHREVVPSDVVKSETGELSSTLLNRNVTIAGHRTSVRLEPAMWSALREVCERERMSIHDVVTAIARERAESSITSAIRVYLLTYFQAAATENGHRSAGHGAGACARTFRFQPPV